MRENLDLFEHETETAPTNRFKGQLGRVYDQLRHGAGATLQQLSERIHQCTGKWDSEAAISARLRDLRNKHGLNVQKERRIKGSNQYVYWIEKE